MTAAALPRPAPPAVRVARALAMAAAAATTPHRYFLSGGDLVVGSPLPLTWATITKTVAGKIVKERVLVADCAAAVMHALEVPRKRPGFNSGSWSVVTGYVNTDSAIQDAQHRRELFELVTGRPEPGDIVCWPSIYEGELERDPAKRRRRGKRVRIGHIAIVVEVRAAEWSWASPNWELLWVAQCGSTHTPAIHLSSAAAWANRQRTRWDVRPEWASVLLRPIA